MKYTKKQLAESAHRLYDDIDRCHQAIINARISHNKIKEGMELYRLEGLSVAALQELSVHINYFENDNEN